VTLSWDDLPDEDSEFTTSDGELDLTLSNASGAAVAVDLTFTLFVRGQEVDVVDSFTVSTTYATALDLDDFIPTGVNAQAGDPTLYSSAWIVTHAVVERGGEYVEDAWAPVLYGHIDTGTSEAILYRKQAMDDNWNGGDLGAIGLAQNPSAAVQLSGVAHGFGTECVPTE
jgi:hypothetical protein